MRLDPTVGLHSKLLAYDIPLKNACTVVVCKRFTLQKSGYRVWMKRLQNIRQDFSIRVYDVAVVLVFGNINADVGHGVSLLDIVLMLLDPQASCHS